LQENVLNLVSHPLFLLSLGVIFALIANYLRDRRLEREEASLRDEALRDEETLQALGSAPLSSTNRTNLADR
jgi:hypothetical protein